MMTIEELKPNLLALSESERLALAEFLFESLEDGTETARYDVNDEEVFRRMAEAEVDPSVLITSEEFHRRVTAFRA